MSFRSAVVAAVLVAGALVSPTFAFSNSGNENLAVYWGQNSYGATHTDTTNWQQNLSYYCQDDVIDVIPLAFLDVYFDTGGAPSVNLANICNDSDDPAFAGTDLPNCQFMAADIQTCQAAGKIVTLSLGGATGSDTFSSDDQATQFANTIWDMFLGGSSTTRPFGEAVLDGIDLDIEGGSTTYYTTFINELRSLATGLGKPFYLSGAPQCPFPDAYLGSVINAVGFDMLYVQFYNNYCGVNNFADSNDWNFATWDSWAKSTSPNPNVKIYIGAPASSTAAGSGYVDAATLGSIVDSTRSAYSSFGGVMLWDASQAYANDRYDEAIKSALTSGGTPATGNPSSTTKTSSTTTTISTTTSSSSKTTTTSISSTSSSSGQGQCAGVAAWVSNVAYTGGEEVTYAGHLWTAKYWSEADAPGGAAGDWTDDGICSSAATVKVDIPAYHINPTVVQVTGSGHVIATLSAHSAKATATEVTKKNSRFFKY